MFKYFKPYLFRGFLASLFKMGESFADLSLPYFMALIIDNGVGNHNINYIIKIATLMVIISLLGYSSSILSNYLSCKTSQEFGSNLRKVMFTKIQFFSFEKTNKYSQSSLITRITKDVNQITQMFLMCIRMVLRGLTTGFGAIVMAVIINPVLSIIFLIIAPIIVFLTTYYVKKSFNLYKIVQNKLDILTLILRENLSGIKVIKALSKENMEKSKFNTSSEELKDDTIIADSVMLSKLPFITLTMNIGIVAVLWFGGLRVHYGKLQVGEVVAFINYLNMILFSMNALSFLFSLYSKTSVSYRRVSEVLNEKTEAQNNITISNNNSNIAIEFQDVYFSYKNNKNYVLENINLKIQKGEHIGIIGSIGSGKSTLVSLIFGFYKPTLGKILINGIDIENYNNIELRKKIGIILQKTFLFSQTIGENIAFGNKNSKNSDIEKVAKISQADDFIRNFPDSYETLVEKSGSNLSGGQKQRISIARTLLKKPEILIFDDSFSALDFITENNLKNDLNNFLKNTTTLIIASKISTLQNMDKILVLNNGEIVGFDTHKNLLKNNQIYKEICISQEIGGIYE